MCKATPEHLALQITPKACPNEKAVNAPSSMSGVDGLTVTGIVCMAFKLPSVAVTMTVAAPAATGVRVTVLSNMLAATVLGSLEVAANVSGSSSGSRKYGATSTRLALPPIVSVCVGIAPTASGAWLVPGVPFSPCTASRSSVKCTAMTEVTPGMICGSVHAGGICPHARYAASRAVRGCVMCTALMGVTPETMSGSVQETLASPHWRRAASMLVRSPVR